MNICLCLPDREKSRRLCMELESWDEAWSVTETADGREALFWLERSFFDVLALDAAAPLLDGPGMVGELGRGAYLPLPKVLALTYGPVEWAADAVLPATSDAQAMIPALTALALTPIPLLARPLLPALSQIADGYLEQLGMGAHLKGRGYAREMIAWAAANPRLQSAVTTELYPLASRQFQATPASVERCLRHAIETAWTSGDVDALEALFGNTVDPERGKPTNREFLSLLCRHVTEAYLQRTARAAGN